MISKISYFILFIYSFSALSSFKENNFSKKQHAKSSIKIQHLWSVDTVQTQFLKPSLIHNGSPLLVDNLVIQGNGINGVKAFTQDLGKLVWSFPVQGGVFSSLEAHKGQLYFGASDGFFYSLDIRTGNLIWKFFTGSENLGAPLIYKNRIYWTTSNQKLYALSLQGSLHWIYAGTPLTRNLIVRGRPRPTIYKNYIYMGFYDGTVVALNRATGKLKWKQSLSPKESVYGDLARSRSCLLVSTFDSYLFCLNFLNGKLKWKKKGGSFVFPEGSLFYQANGYKISALNKLNRKKKWSVKLKSTPILPSVYKKYLLYGSLEDGEIYLAHKKTGQILSKLKFGKGLSGSITINKKQGDFYFLSLDSQLHKARIHF